MKHLCLNTAHRQRGATLVVALIFLVLLSLFAFNAFNSSSTNVRVVGNQQMRQEAISAAQSAIEAVISTTTFSITPANVAATPITVDIDNNGVVDYTVSMSPQPSCYRVQPIKNNQLNFAVPTDRECITSGLIRNSGIDTTDTTVSADDSLCSNTEWNLRAVVTDTATGANVAVNQGVALRVVASDASSYCN
jgi:Tfp pilus assembly protein PilX